MEPEEILSGAATGAKGALSCLFAAWIVFMGTFTLIFFLMSATGSGSVGLWLLTVLALAFGGLAGVVIFPAGLLAAGSLAKERRLRHEAHERGADAKERSRQRSDGDDRS